MGRSGSVDIASAYTRRAPHRALAPARAPPARDWPLTAHWPPWPLLAHQWRPLGPQWAHAGAPPAPAASPRRETLIDWLVLVECSDTRRTRLNYF